VRAAVASRGRAERIMEDDKLGGTEEGVSSGMLSVIVVACLLTYSRNFGSSSINTPPFQKCRSLV